MLQARRFTVCNFTLDCGEVIAFEIKIPAQRDILEKFSFKGIFVFIKNLKSFLKMFG